jgi:3-hydroxybutyryl-CoA dehydrogenase
VAIETITVIGANPTGRGIACGALAAGYRVVLEDVLPERLAAARAEIRAWFEKSAAGSVEQTMARLFTAGSIDLACREAGLVIESLPEEMEMKIDVFCILEKFARPRAILASNTSFSVTEIAAMTTRRDCCVGMRFTVPVAEMKRLEIVRGRETSEETVELCREFGRRLGKEVAVQAER